MAKKRGGKRDRDRAGERVSTSDTSALTSNPFAALAPNDADDDPVDVAPDAGDVTAASDSARTTPARAVIRYERKGRGGKEVTVVELRGLEPSALDQLLGRWLSELRRELGCGGFIEDGALVLSGDQRDRLPAILERRGVDRVS